MNRQGLIFEPKQMTERMAKEEYEKMGFKVYKMNWPDFLLVHRGTRKVVFAEVKTVGDRMSRGQAASLALLSQLGFDVEVGLVTPTSFSVRKMGKTSFLLKAEKRVKVSPPVKQQTEEEELEEILSFLPKTHPFKEEEKDV